MPGIVKNAQNPDAGVGVPEAHRTLLSTAIDVIDHDGNNIGYIQQVNDSANRGTTPIRGLNAADAGRILEQSPSPENRTLACTGFALFNKQNDGSLVQRIGGSTTAKKMRSLEEQKIPFNLIMKEIHPTTLEEEVTIYHDCWITSMSKPANIGTSTISMNCNITVSWTE